VVAIVQTSNKEQYYKAMETKKKRFALKTANNWRYTGDWKNIKKDIDEASARFWAKRHMAPPGSDFTIRKK